MDPGKDQNEIRLGMSQPPNLAMRSEGVALSLIEYRINVRGSGRLKEVIAREISVYTDLAVSPTRPNLFPSG